MARSGHGPPHTSPSTLQDQKAQQPPKFVIPTQRRVTEQLTKRQHKATVADSTLRVEMNALEEQADNAKARDLSSKPLSWLGTIRPTSANDAFDPALWETFVSTTLGLGVPVLSSLPRLHNSALAKCG